MNGVESDLVYPTNFAHLFLNFLEILIRNFECFCLLIVISRSIDAKQVPRMHKVHRNKDKLCNSMKIRPIAAHLVFPIKYLWFISPTTQFSF